MAILTTSDLSRMAGQEYKSVRFAKSLTDAVRLEKSFVDIKYDIFLSHSYLDRDTVEKLNYVLEEELGLSVYVDWIENPELNRESVTPETARSLRSAMDRSSSLLYAISTSASASKWMPWELGYSDAKHGRVAVLPIEKSSTASTAYRSQEFVGLYPRVERDKMANDTSGKDYLWAYDPRKSTRYSRFDYWLKNGDLLDH